MGRPRKSQTSKEKLNSVIEVDGKVASDNPTALDQIWGADGASRYGTMNFDEYVAQLDDMLPVDLQNHARDVGLRPDVELHTLRSRLEAEFQKYVASFRGATITTRNSKPSSIPKNIHKILREGA